MRIELLIYVALILSLLALIAGMHTPTMSYQILYSCNDLIAASSVHSAGTTIPCHLDNNKIVYRGSSLPLSSTSYGVVVKGEHWTAP